MLLKQTPTVLVLHTHLLSGGLQPIVFSRGHTVQYPLLVQFTLRACIQLGTRLMFVLFRQYGSNAIPVPNSSAADRLSYLHKELQEKVHCSHNISAVTHSLTHSLTHYQLQDFMYDDLWILYYRWYCVTTPSLRYSKDRVRYAW